jgi:hypothetical protein
MAKAGTDFELLVQAIYQEIIDEEKFDTINVEHDIKIKGKSGQAHQIDVYWEIMIAGVLNRVAVECKDYATKISLGKVRDFSSALDDIGNIVGIFVTTKGYQLGAKKFAEHKGIALKTVNTPTQEEMNEMSGITGLTLNFHAIRVTNVVMTPDFDINWILRNTQIKKGDNVQASALNGEVEIQDAKKNVICTVKDLEDSLPHTKETSIGLHKQYDYDDAYLYFPNSIYPPLKINKLSFKYDSIIDTETSELEFVTMAKALLKDISTDEIKFHQKEVKLLKEPLIKYKRPL